MEAGREQTTTRLPAIMQQVFNEKVAMQWHGTETKKNVCRAHGGR